MYFYACFWLFVWSLNLQESNLMWHSTIGTYLKPWKTSTRDGSALISCMRNVVNNFRRDFQYSYDSWYEKKYLYMIHVCYRKDFATYAETCFQKFGDRVKHWITFNEPHTFTTQGYDVGLQAPGRCSILLHLFCRAGNSATEPYIVAHNVLLTHAAVADIYRKKYKVKFWIFFLILLWMRWNE
jgi:hypothetical protein